MTWIFALTGAAVAGLAVLAWPAARVFAAARALRAEVDRARSRVRAREELFRKISPTADSDSR
ncbi:hypothetical protein [Microbispora triticiradicis]|uniref:DUF4229 domain-containing protein n=3 Tax=Microbispora TaxID=2005 RepID=A0ABY3M189_9ACTN|nr:MULTISPECIES: hypothetical protein [Microbispora]GLW23157.1 hypothetical protein Mame01_32000 [Microbispora amethystogenes]MBO4272916.1 hypothetical protein [Microbispora triticiradicis]RGA02612.1 hypothetical protein DI270_023560 [Microbispora triticiradicis]TLP59713.1 hypothetical protein FED44_15655 [Microbispora fusca]TYB63427.1 hypothetical protein FXF59_08815 [Microbispora tritici]